MKRLGFIAALAMMLMAFLASVALAAGAPTFDPAAAPSGTHVQTGAPSCSFGPGALDVTCSSYELGGVGNTNATASLTAQYSATVDCRNNGGNVVATKTGSFTAGPVTAELSPKNGRLRVPSLSVTAPTAAEFLAQQTCPNPNWTPEIRTPPGIQFVSSLYTLSFAGFNGAFITIIDP
jgi:hypothetical protein